MQFAEAIDISFIGPNPAINAWAQSEGTAIEIISGSTSGGAYLVVKPEITSVDQLKGLTLATPSLGNTQDVALRAWLKENGLETTPEGGGASSALDAAVTRAVNAGVVFAIAAGNSSAKACNYSPARIGGSLNGAITTAATDSSNKEASFSNYGSCVDTWAPGVSIVVIQAKTVA